MTEEIQGDVEIILEKIDNYSDINSYTIKKSIQNELEFWVRKNAYIYNLLDEGAYLISINPIYERSKDYNLRIGGENEYLENISLDKFLNLSNYFKNKYNFNNQIININIIKSQYILLEKAYYYLKIYQ